jgi:hypothetical protein
LGQASRRKWIHRAGRQLVQEFNDGKRPAESVNAENISIRADGLRLLRSRYGRDALKGLEPVLANWDGKSISRSESTWMERPTL